MRNRTHRLGAAVSFVALLGAIGSAQGCGPSASSFCSELRDCIGMSDNEYDECIDEYEDQEKRADDEGCTDQFDELASCYDSQLECRGSEIDLDGCDKEEEALEKCLR